MQRIQELDKGWSLLQDVHNLGETSRIYEPGWVDTDVFKLFSEWEGIEYLSHLQPMLSETPYFGRELRYFNHAPWWYRNAFLVPSDAPAHAALRFEGVDYYCKVWLNGQLVGEHEGYSSPFEFEVGYLLNRGEENLLIVKVSSPWDNEVLPGEEYRRVHRRLCGMFKGTYEHDDTFIQRDVNPIGIWNKVRVIFHSGVHVPDRMEVSAVPDSGMSSAQVSVSANVHCSASQDATACLTILDADTGLVVERCKVVCNLKQGNNPLNLSITLQNPCLWEMWERGRPRLYTAVLSLSDGNGLILERRERFGVRRAELIRTNEKIRFRLNGKDVFLRGAAYFPDVYVSKMSRERYLRDVSAAKQAGLNALRIHVHVARQEFYDVCDELGMLVIQDSDFNWAHPTDPDFTARAMGVFGDMVRSLYNHPSIVCWVVMNEPQDTTQRDFMGDAPGPQLLAELKRLDPLRPYIKGSCYQNDPESGDTHDYTGAFGDESCHYLQYDVTTQRLNTEFGMDAPPVAQNLRSIPKLYRRVKALEGKLASLQYYQYRLLKHVIESFRLSKYAPCGGYFQFMFIDLCPQSWYGVFDWWGVPKEGLRALQESNQPVAVFLKLVGGRGQIWAVNDLAKPLPELMLRWTVSDTDGNPVWSGELPVGLRPDSLQMVTEKLVALQHGGLYSANLSLEDGNRNVVAWNRYDDLTNHPAHPKGHSYRMSHELGVRLFDA